jgi:hypothetical protein
VNDLKGLFTNSKVGEVFSSKGLDALAKVEFWKLIIFYFYAAKTILFFYFLRKGYLLDQ